MRVFLVNPACLDVRITDEDAMAVPIGLFYIGAYLKKNGFDVDIVNLAPLSEPVSSLMKLVEKDKPDIVAFSVLHANRHCAMESASAVKKLNPETVTVFGGPGATFSPYLFLKECPALDYIVKGEGEETFLELVRYLDTASNEQNDEQNDEQNNEQNREHRAEYSIKGLFFRKSLPDSTIDDSFQMIETLSRPLIADLDNLPHPAEFFDFHHLSLSRGCPGQCNFCGSPAFWGKGRVRFHSVKWFVDEIELLVKRGRTHFFISDDTFTMSKKRVLELCHEITSRKLFITWQAISRVDFLDSKMLYEMRMAGCIQISFGVESGSEKIRKTLGKPFKNEKIIKAFRDTAAHGIMPRAYFIYGSPGETKKTIKQSIDLIEKIRPLAMISYILVLFPGTALYDKAVDKKIVPLDSWIKKCEDIPWFEVDPLLDFHQVKEFGKRLRKGFYSKLHQFVRKIELLDDERLFPFHADFLSRLAMTFSHGEYANHPDVLHPEKTAEFLYEKALGYAPDTRAFLGLAMLMQKRRDFPGAVSLLKDGLGYFHDDRKLNICMAISLMNMGHFREALSYLEPFAGFEEVIPYINACLERLSV
ncbi:putative Fe-S oxidoreductase family protein [Desulfamplus magnetovallimortis]|uniref:Putative Fe-S oxidoreductase family protein n=1 Tax=Desulfamplus magnetovallimortis TaxID=1246637 RepID=A0A1W1H5C5_9BACT|nr:radical SAM protein [Desulfamplus magnetovallimortis]SLM27652.1 putative Fe-S oxidoreductase family protein [Desulfamplus magnetovallimortis]